MSSEGFWKMMPTWRRTALASRTMSWPAMRTLPEVGASVVVRIEIVVVLPAPSGPRRAKNSPASTSNEIPSTALTLPFRYRLTRSRTSIAGAISALRLPRRRQMLPRQHRVGVLERVLGIEVEAARFLGQHLERPFELHERAELERIEGDGDDPVESPHHAVLLVGELDVKAELGEKVESRVSVFDLDLGLFAHLDASDEPGRPLRGEQASWASVQHAESQRGPARGLAGAVEAIVFFVVFTLEPSASLAQQCAQPRVVGRPRDAELQLAFETAIARAMVWTAPGHGGEIIPSCCD